jgi:putative addiction module component (TIGR02574 family)
MIPPSLDIDRLTPAERLRLIEQLWESLRTMASAVPLTPQQREELDQRLDDLEQSGPEGIPWDEVLRNIRKRGD